MLHIVIRALLYIYVLPFVFNAVILLVRGRPLLLTEDESRHGLLPPPATDQTARVRILFHRGRTWRALFGGHSFIVYKPKGAAQYIRYDWDNRGEPIRNEGWVVYEPGYGTPPGFVYGASGWHAEQLIPAIETSIAAYAARHVHDYRRFPGPNSNTFVQGVIDGVGFMDAVMTPLAIGKDYPHTGSPVRRLHSGVLISLLGLVSVRIGWIEGFELSLFGLVAGVDWRRPALKIPSLGRIGMSASPKPPITQGSGRVMLADQQAQMEERKARNAGAGHRPHGPGGGQPPFVGGGRMRGMRRR